MMSASRGRFIALKIQYEEPIDEITFDRFVQHLRTARMQYVQKHGETAIKFKVYSKNGRVAIKARPIRMTTTSEK